MSRKHRPGTRVAARVGLFAVLFQALLFGWHHHDLAFAQRLPAPLVENPSPAPMAADDEDGCEICQVLHHVTATPIDFIGAPPPRSPVLTVAPSDFRLHATRAALAFRARAPPAG